MLLIYNFISNFIVIIVALLFYRKICNEESNTLKKDIIIATLYATYTVITFQRFIEPWRLIVGFLGVVGLMRIPKYRLSSIITSILISYFLWLSASVVAANIIVILRLENSEVLFYLVPLSVELAFYYFAHRLLKLEKGYPMLEDKEISLLIFVITTLTLYLYGSLYSMTEVSEYIEHVLYYRLIWNYVIISIAVIAATFYLIHLLVQKQREKMELEKEKIRIEQREAKLKERTTLAQTKLLEKIKIAKQEHRELVKIHHDFRGIIPTVLTLTHGLAEDLVNIVSADKPEQIERVENLIGMLQNLGKETNTKFLERNLQTQITTMNFPGEWMEIAFTIGELMTRADGLGIHFFIKNEATTWDKLEIEKVYFISLIHNLIGNAIKEVAKNKNKKMMITVRFKEDEEGHFMLEVIDNAAHFPIHILQNLGTQGNSINGTGDGYPEIFTILDKVYASYEIIEWIDESGEHLKNISIFFDNTNSKAIQSNYRSNELESALEHSVFETIL